MDMGGGELCEDEDDDWGKKMLVVSTDFSSLLPFRTMARNV